MIPFNPFSALTSKIFGGVSLVLILAIGILLLAKNHEISSLRDQIDNPKTGYKAQLARVNQDLGTCHGNNAALTKALNDQNGSIDRLAAQGKATAEASAAQLATIRKNNATEDANLQAIIGAVPGTLDSCSRADQMILQVAQNGGR